MTILKNSKGQSLIEYLIIVAIVAIGSMGVMRIVGHNVEIQFANIAKALGGKQTEATSAESVEAKHYSKRDLSNFMEGAASTNESNSGKN